MLILSKQIMKSLPSASLSRRKDANSQRIGSRGVNTSKSIKKEGC